MHPGERVLRPLARRAGAGLAALLLACLPAVPVAADEVRDRQQWVLDAMGVEQAWEISRGTGVTVAVLDSRVDAELPELAGRVSSAPDMVRARSGDERLPPGEHGTQMAALIAAAGAGGGYVGIAPEARILSVPVVTDDPEESVDPSEERLRVESPLARGIRYAVNHGAKVISLSIGAYGARRLDRDAVAYALSRGVVLVASVGNDGDSAYSLENGTSYWSFPAGYSGVIGVGAVDRRGRPASFSNDNLSVLVAAPGVDVPMVTLGGGYGEGSGTSPAAALVSGVAALIKAKYPDMRPELVARAIATGTRGRPTAGYDDKVGFGIVNAAAALRAAGGLVDHRRSLPVPEDLRFGPGPLAGGPSRPGPDPLRLWVYGLGVALGLVAFGGGVVVLTRRAERE